MATTLSSAQDRTRRFVTSSTWHAIVALLIVVDFTLQLLTFGGQLSETHPMDIAVDTVIVVVFGVEVVLRVAAFHFRFFQNHRNIACLVVVVMAVVNLVFTIERPEEAETLVVQGFLIGALLIRLFWVFWVLSQTQTETTDPQQSRCLETLLKIKQKLEDGQEIDMGVKVEEIEYVIDAIRQDTIHSGVFSNLMEENQVEGEQGRFLELMFSDGSFQKKRKASSSGRSASQGRSSLFGTVHHESTLVDDEVVSMDSEVANHLSFCGDWDFDIFRLAEISQTPLTVLGLHLFRRLSLVSFLGVDDQVVSKWLTSVERGYRRNPYHNSTHAADVLHAVYYFLAHCGVGEHLEPIEVLACVVAAIIHDYGHVGKTNNFLSLTFHKLAITYNNVGVLENYHCSQGWQLCTSEKHNIFEYLDKEQLKYVRELIILMVLDTDMSRHAKLSSKFKSKLDQGIQMEEAEDRKMVMSMLLHTADLGNGARPPKLSQQWSKCVMTEFFNQGDEEKQLSLPVSPNMDRDGGDELIAKCQLTFLKFVVKPTYTQWCRLISELHGQLDGGVDANSSGSGGGAGGDSSAAVAATKSIDLFQSCLNANMSHWQARVDVFSPPDRSQEGGTQGRRMTTPVIPTNQFTLNSKRYSNLE